MAFSKTLSLSLYIFFPCFLSLSQAYTFYVGGKDGWVLNPSESYDNWANRNRFRVNDVLVFNYARGSDSVAVVGKEDYDKCDLNNPIVKLEDGNSKFKFDRSGAFYFASGKQGMCENGQKLAVVVISQHSFSLSSKLASTPPEISPTSPLSLSETLGSPMPSSEMLGSPMPSSEMLGSFVITIIRDTQFVITIIRDTQFVITIIRDTQFSIAIVRDARSGPDPIRCHGTGDESYPVRSDRRNDGFDPVRSNGGVDGSDPLRSDWGADDVSIVRGVRFRVADV
uniref:Phytocyanin domain-containing protein n=1 Tax=Cucumis sativus TaxID=3659 RepID=A0A0A0KZL9_CUCSA